MVDPARSQKKKGRWWWCDQVIIPITVQSLLFQKKKTNPISLQHIHTYIHTCTHIHMRCDPGYYHDFLRRKKNERGRNYSFIRGNPLGYTVGIDPLESLAGQAWELLT